MQKRTREIAALVLLAVLGAGAMLAMGWYILAGHGWNVTASNIDDSIGQMDGYTVLLLEGTRQPEAVEAKRLAREAAEAASSSGAAPSAAAAGEGAAPSDAAAAPDAAADAAAAPEPSAAAGGGESGGVAEPPSDDAADGDALDIEVDGEGFSIDALGESYRDKGAEVYRIDVAGRNLYAEPLVVSRGERRVGVFALDYPARPAAVMTAQKLLARQEADLKVVITNDPTLEDARLPGIDIIICDIADEEPLKGYYRNSAYCVDTPYEGEVEAIIISPSGVVSSKTIGPS